VGLGFLPLHLPARAQRVVKRGLAPMENIITQSIQTINPYELKLGKKKKNSELISKSMENISHYRFRVPAITC
jgi:hypothetical protein